MKAELLLILGLTAAGHGADAPKSWAADNGNGTCSNPLFYDEFSDPDMIRVGADYYLTGTTMHAMPGLPILHSRDLVNWRIIGYAFDRLDLGPAFRLENGQEIYGQGIWVQSGRLRRQAAQPRSGSWIAASGDSPFRPRRAHTFRFREAGGQAT